MRAVIIAAGRGRRLDPHTRVRPKPLLYVAGRPILAHLLDALPALGITDVVIVVGYLREQIAAYLRTRPGRPAHLVIQERLLGNGHAVYAARASLEGPVLILFGDTILKADLRLALEREVATIGVTEVSDARTYGVVEVDARGRILRLREKPEAPSSRLAVSGVYYFPDPRPLRGALEDLVTRGGQRRGEYWFADAVQLLIDRGEPVTTFPVDRFYDCGTVERLLRANRDLLAVGAGEARGAALRLPGSVITSPCAIAPGAVVADSRIGPFVTVAPGARVVRAQVSDAVVHPGAVLEDAVVEHAIVDEPAPEERAGRGTG